MTITPNKDYGSGTIDNNIVYEAVKKHIEGSFATYLTANNRTETITGGDVVITLENVAQDGLVYDKSNLQAQTPNGVQLSYKIDKDRLAAVELNTFDINSGRSPNYVALQSMFISGIANSIQNGILCEYAELVSNALLQNSNYQIELPNFSARNVTVQQATEDTLALSEELASLTQIFDKHVVSANPEDNIVIFNRQAQINRAKYLQWSNSDKSFDLVGLNGGKTLNRAFGITYFVDNLICDNFVKENRSFASKTYDFQNIKAYAINKDSLSFNFKILPPHQVPLSGGIIRFEFPYILGGLVFLPELNRLVVGSAVGQKTATEIILATGNKPLQVGVASELKISAKPFGVSLPTNLTFDIVQPSTATISTDLAAGTVTIEPNDTDDIVVIIKAGDVDYGTQTLKVSE